MRNLFLTAFLFLTASTNVFSLEARKPNIIVIFTDDHGWTDLGSQGIRNDLKTPYLDELAAAGLRMTNGYVTAPQCVPSRAGLLSGRYQNRFGVESNGLPLTGFNAQLTIAERLKKAGFATGMTGKWHLGPAPEIVKHGFDDVYYKNANRPGWANFSLDGTDREPGAEAEKGYHLDVNSNAACAFIKRHSKKPFFFYCAYRAPHVPLDAPPKYTNRFPGKMPERRRQALAMISAVDDGIGKILKTLRQYKLEENTLIFVIGDNGAPLKIHKYDAPGKGAGWDGSLNDPLNGEKGMLTEGGVRVPFLVYWKGRIPGGKTYDHPVISLDVAATANALAGLPDDPKLDGVNLIPYLTGANNGAPHDTLYWRWVSQTAIREGQWKLLRGGDRAYLFDLNSDPEEKKNLLQKHPEIAARLTEKLTTWTSELKPPGLETKAMSSAATQYFDFYLDGKPAPPRRDFSIRGRVQNWIARGCVLNTKNDVLQIEPQKEGGRNPFIANTGFKLKQAATINIKIKSSTDGKVGASWRFDGQKDFEAKQGTQKKFAASDEWQNVELDLDPSQTIVHLRVLLPGGIFNNRKDLRLQQSWQDH